MKHLDLTLSNPQENLACDEALLELCENGGNDDIIRFWEPQRHFVVLGYSRPIHADTHLSLCRKQDVPILRRCSGGGTVLQGPGCLNFSLILDTSESEELRSLSGTNRYIMRCHQRTIEQLTGEQVEVQGDTDLTLNSLKFSGNSQRRGRRFTLFHGTFLLSLELGIVEKYLPIPDKQPGYRKNRGHREFLTNLNLPSELIKETLRTFWGAQEPLPHVPLEAINRLAKTRYATDEWNAKF